MDYNLYDGYVYVFCALVLCVQCLVWLRFILIAVAGVQVVWGCPLRCVRWILFIKYVASFFYARRLRMLRALLQKPPYVVTVVEFCVYLIHLSIWYCKLRQRSFVRFLVLCFRWSQKDALCFIVGPIVVLAVRWHCGGCPNCELWPRLVTVQWSELWHVNSLQSLCWEIGDKSRSWNKFYFSYRSRWIKLCMYKAVVAA